MRHYGQGSARCVEVHVADVAALLRLGCMGDLVRVLWWLATLALVGIFGYAVWALPSQVPMHVDLAGNVTEWGDKTGLLAGLATGVGSSVLVGWLARGIGRSMSLDFVNVPSKDRWLPDHEAELRERVSTDLYAVGAITSAMIGALTLGMVAIAHGAPMMPSWATIAGIGCVAVLLIQVVVMITVRYRSPG